MVDLYPIPSRMNISRESWLATPQIIRDEIVRAWMELEKGIAVRKDARCGRRKSHGRHGAAVSFYELYCLEMEAWARPDIVPLQQEIAALRAKLAPDVERMKANDDLAEFHELAIKSGTTLAEALGKYIAVEKRLRTDFDNEIVRILENCGVDPDDFATVTLAGVHLAHSMFLEKAAEAIRDDPDRNWDGVCFGFMADQVEAVLPSFVIMQPNGYRAVDYGRLSRIPEARSLQVHVYRYKDGGDGSIPDAVA